MDKEKSKRRKKIPLKDIMDNLGAPGGLFQRQDSSSAFEGGFPDRSLLWNQKQAAFIAFSTEHEPQAIVCTSFSPFGAMDIKDVRSFCTISAGGKTPKAGRLTMVAKLAGSLAAFNNSGWL